MKIHDLKLFNCYFDDIATERKTFEVRKNDRNFKIGDVLHLKEYSKSAQCYLARRMFAKVVYILDNEEYLKSGYAVLGIKIIKNPKYIRKLTDIVSESILRVCWTRNGYTTHYKVDNIDEAISLLELLANIDLKTDDVIWSSGELEILLEGEWVDYYDENGLDIIEIMENKNNGNEM